MCEELKMNTVTYSRCSSGVAEKS